MRPRDCDRASIAGEDSHSKRGCLWYKAAIEALAYGLPSR